MTKGDHKMIIPFNLDHQKWQIICQDADWIAANYPSYGNHQVQLPEEVIETALYIGLDSMRDEIIQHQTLEWIVREKNNI
jgi:hypothetical protein